MINRPCVGWLANALLHDQRVHYWRQYVCFASLRRRAAAQRARPRWLPGRRPSSSMPSGRSSCTCESFVRCDTQTPKSEIFGSWGCCASTVRTSSSAISASVVVVDHGLARSLTTTNLRSPLLHLSLARYQGRLCVRLRPAGFDGRIGIEGSKVNKISPDE